MYNFEFHTKLKGAGNSLFVDMKFLSPSPITLTLIKVKGHDSIGKIK